MSRTQTLTSPPREGEPAGTEHTTTAATTVMTMNKNAGLRSDDEEFLYI